MQNELNPQDLQSLVTPLLDLCRDAGEAICEHYRAPGADEYQSKHDDSPLTLADLASHRCLSAGLSRLEPHLPLLSEESPPEQVSQRQQWSQFWLVDPLDGTKEFLARTGEFTINLALVEAGLPVLGMLYLPLEHKAYVGIPGLWARCYRSVPDGGWSHDDISCRSLTADRPMVVLASRRHRGRRLEACLEWLRENWGPLERDNSGSALKFCQLAAGDGDFYPRFSPCSEWDTAAGQALLEAAGGGLFGLDGEPLRYNVRDSLLSPDFIAVGDRDHPLWQRLLPVVAR